MNIKRTHTRKYRIINDAEDAADTATVDVLLTDEEAIRFTYVFNKLNSAKPRGDYTPTIEIRLYDNLETHKK